MHERQKTSFLSAIGLAFVCIFLSPTHRVQGEDASGDSRATAVGEFPELSNPDSVFSKAYRTEEAFLRKSQPQFFNDVNWPVMLAYRVANKLGVSTHSEHSEKVTPQPITVTPTPVASISSVSPEELAAKMAPSILIIEGDRGSGTGFILKKENKSFIVTNAHVLNGNTKLSIKSQSSKYNFPKTLMVSQTRDVVMSECEGNPEGLENVKDISQNILTNDEVIVVGNSSGSNVSRLISGKLLGVGNDLVETDAPFVRGNSGSPVVHLKTGKVLGVATFASQKKKDVFMADSDLKEIRRFAYRTDNIDDFENISTDAFLKVGSWLQFIADRNEIMIAAIKVSPRLTYESIGQNCTEFERVIRENSRNCKRTGDVLGLEGIPSRSAIQSFTTYHKRILRDLLKTRLKIIAYLPTYPVNAWRLSVASSQGLSTWAEVDEVVKYSLSVLGEE